MGGHACMFLGAIVLGAAAAYASTGEEGLPAAADKGALNAWKRDFYAGRARREDASTPSVALTTAGGGDGGGALTTAAVNTATVTVLATPVPVSTLPTATTAQTPAPPTVFLGCNTHAGCPAGKYCDVFRNCYTCDYCFDVFNDAIDG